jgi:hypothetical protein
MNSFHKITLALSALTLTAGCASVSASVMPTPDGNYEIFTTGKTKFDAMRWAKQDAETTCKKATGNKNFVYLDKESQFTGVKIDRGEGGTVRSLVASAAEFAAMQKNATNYDVTVKFRCVGSGPVNVQQKEEPTYIEVDAKTVEPVSYRPAAQPHAAAPYTDEAQPESNSPAAAPKAVAPISAEERRRRAEEAFKRATAQ